MATTRKAALALLASAGALSVAAPSVATAPEQLAGALPRALDKDDACSAPVPRSEGGSRRCALSALQVRGRRTGAAEGNFKEHAEALRQGQAMDAHARAALDPPADEANSGGKGTQVVDTEELEAAGEAHTEGGAEEADETEGGEPDEDEFEDPEAGDAEGAKEVDAEEAAAEDAEADEAENANVTKANRKGKGSDEAEEDNSEPEEAEQATADS